MVAYTDMIYPDTELEEKLWDEGYRYVLGIDEAGRGPLAGPVVAGGVVLSNSCELIAGVRDSKTMTRKRREETYAEIKKKSLAYGVGVVESQDIDEYGIQRAVLNAMIGVVKETEERLGEKVDCIIADGENILDIPGYRMLKIKNGDMLHYSIAAGSVLAKVTRDRIMRSYHEEFPEYGFDSNVGYGTKEHMKALEKYGFIGIHRKTFGAVGEFKERIFS